MCNGLCYRYVKGGGGHVSGPVDVSLCGGQVAGVVSVALMSTHATICTKKFSGK